MSTSILPIILGTDNNSYSAARSYHAAYGKKALVCGSAVLIPFINSKIAHLRIAKGFSQEDSIFRETIEQAYRDYAEPGQKVMFFVPNEDYLFQIYRNLSQFSFEVVLPYPAEDLAHLATDKKLFYAKMEELGLPIPKTWRIGPDNFQTALAQVEDDRHLFLKAADYSDFQAFDFPAGQKGYNAPSKASAQESLDAIYQAGYLGDFIVQDFVPGGEGSEYSVMGYRAADGQIRMVQARALLSDLRPKWVGNHLVLVDSKRKDVEDLAKKTMEALDYTGFFNLDIKDGGDQLFILECNPRLGRSFIYATFAGLNLIQLAIDQVEKGSLAPEVAPKPFLWHVVSKEVTRKKLAPYFLYLWDDAARQENAGTSLDYGPDNSPFRTMRLRSYQKRLDEATFRLD